MTMLESLKMVEWMMIEWMKLVEWKRIVELMEDGWMGWIVDVWRDERKTMIEWMMMAEWMTMVDWMTMVGLSCDVLIGSRWLIAWQWLIRSQWLIESRCSMLMFERASGKSWLGTNGCLGVDVLSWMLYDTGWIHEDGRTDEELEMVARII